MSEDLLKKLQARYAGHVPGLLGARSAYAVLCPLIRFPDGPHLLFEVRAAGVRQGGEVCFPGGRLERGERPEEGALRETEEELAIPRREIRVLGRLDFLCNQQGFLLYPLLGEVSRAGFAALRPAPAEVAEVFTVPLSFFLETEPEMYAYELVPRMPEAFPYEAVGIPRTYAWAGGRVEVPVWHRENHVIWGMTGRIVRGLVRSLA